MSELKNYLHYLEQLRDNKEFELVKLRNEIANVKSDIRKTKKMIDAGKEYTVCVVENAKGEVSFREAGDDAQYERLWHLHCYSVRIGEVRPGDIPSRLKEYRLARGLSLEDGKTVSNG